MSAQSRQVRTHLTRPANPGLAQARIGARGTGLGAVEAFLDTPDQGRAVDIAEVGRVGAQHLLYVGHRYLPSSMLGFVGRYPLRGNSQRPQGGSLPSSAESRVSRRG